MSDKQQSYDGPVPPMPKMYAANGNEDFIANVDVYHHAIAAMSDGAPKDMFTWRPDHNVAVGTTYSYHTDELLQHNLRSLQRWESVQKAKQQAAREASSRGVAQDQAPHKGSERDRALGILRWAEDKLSRLGEGVRDAATRDAIYYLGAFVNDGHLTENDVEVSIIAASHNNGLSHDRENGGIAKVRKDIPRGLAKAASDGIHVDWDEMDRRTK